MPYVVGSRMFQRSNSWKKTYKKNEPKNRLQIMIWENATKWGQAGITFVGVTSMTILSLGPGAFRPRDELPSSLPTHWGSQLALKFEELDLLMCVGVEARVWDLGSVTWCVPLRQTITPDLLRKQEEGLKHSGCPFIKWWGKKKNHQTHTRMK